MEQTQDFDAGDKAIPLTGPLIRLFSNLSPSFFSGQLKIALSLWAPAPCDLCGSLLGPCDSQRLCAQCEECLGHEPATPRCEKCDHPLGNGPCPACQVNPLPIPRLRTLFLNEGPGRSLLHHYKYKYRRPHSQTLSRLVIKHLANEVRWAQLLVPIPISRRAHWERDFCPVTLPVGQISKRMALPWAPLLEKIPGGKAQHHQNRGFRKQSPSRFRLRERGGDGPVSRRLPAPLTRILLIDDVVTTGSTLIQGAQILKGAFPEAEIRALAFARTRLRSDAGQDPEEKGQ